MNKTEYMRYYRSTPNGKKRCVISCWKHQGLTGDYDSIYDRYINTTHCDKCKCLLQGKGIDKKCMDHNHITGEFRMVCCQNCNMKTQGKQKNNPNSSVGISWNKQYQKWVYRKQTNGKVFYKRHSNLNELLWLKFVYLLTLQ